MNKKILVVTRKFPPAAGGGVPRLANFVSGLSRHGWETTVIAPKTADGWMDASKDIPIANVEVQRIGEFIRTKRNLSQKIVGRLRYLDPSAGWANSVIDYLTTKNSSSFDALLTTGPPHSVHLVGLRLAKKLNVKWVADFRDQYTLNPNFKTYLPFQKSACVNFESQIYKQADKIITNTRRNRRDVLREFQIRDFYKLVTINNGFDPTELRNTNASPPWSARPPKKYNYAYLGGLRGIKIDSYFFDGFEKAITQSPNLAKEVAIRLVGDSRHLSEKIKRLVDLGSVSIHPPVPADGVGDILSNCDGGLSWQGPSLEYRGMITQKFFEYFGAKKPVFIVGRPDGEMGTIVRRYGLGVAVLPANPEAVAAGFLEFHEGVKKQLFSYNKCPQYLFDQFNRNEQAEKLMRVLNGLV